MKCCLLCKFSCSNHQVILNCKFLCIWDIILIITRKYSSFRNELGTAGLFCSNFNSDAEDILQSCHASNKCKHPRPPGTAAVTVAGLLAAMRSMKVRLSDQTFMFQGAGEVSTIDSKAGWYLHTFCNTRQPISVVGNLLLKRRLPRFKCYLQTARNSTATVAAGWN